MVRADEALWTLEDKKTVHIVMTKADACSTETAWESLLKDDFLADPWTFHEMKKKLDLERFQIEVSESQSLDTVVVSVGSFPLMFLFFW